MNKLAKRAVIGGKAVALSPALCGARAIVAPFFWKTFERFGVKRVAEKIVSQEKLAFEDAEDLLCGVPLSVLMKLVSLRAAQGSTQALTTRLPLPALYVPVLRYSESRSPDELRETLRQALEPVKHESFEVYLDVPKSNDDWERYFGIIEFLRTLSGSIRIVVPSVSDMVGRPSARLLTRRTYPSQELVSRLQVLKALGISRLRSAQSLYDAEVTHQAGFVVSVGHTVEPQLGPRKLAHELIRLNEFGEQVAPVNCWVPGVAGDRTVPRVAGVLDLTLLRVLAVGSIVLTHVEFRRASNRYFSSFGLALSKICGANDFGYGARDRFTARELDFMTFDEVLSAVHGTAAA